MDFHDHGPAFRGCSDDRHWAIAADKDGWSKWTVYHDGAYRCRCCRDVIVPAFELYDGWAL